MILQKSNLIHWTVHPNRFAYLGHICGSKSISYLIDREDRKKFAVYQYKNGYTVVVGTFKNAKEARKFCEYHKKFAKH